MTISGKMNHDKHFWIQQLKNWPQKDVQYNKQNEHTRICESPVQNLTWFCCIASTCFKLHRYMDIWREACGRSSVIQHSVHGSMFKIQLSSISTQDCHIYGTVSTLSLRSLWSNPSQPIIFFVTNCGRDFITDSDVNEDARKCSISKYKEHSNAAFYTKFVLVCYHLCACLLSSPK